MNISNIYDGKIQSNASCVIALGNGEDFDVSNLVPPSGKCEHDPKPNSTQHLYPNDGKMVQSIKSVSRIWKKSAPLKEEKRQPQHKADSSRKQQCLAPSCCHSTSRASIQRRRESDYAPKLPQATHTSNNGYLAVASDREELTIEILPDLRVPYCSIEATRKAINNNEHTKATCYACGLALICKRGLAYVLCPDCHVVSPIEYTASPTAPERNPKPQGIGIGFVDKFSS